MPPALRSAVWPWRVAASPVSCPAQQQHDRWRRPPARHRAAAPCPPARLPEKPSPLQRPLPAPLAACSALLCSALLCSALVTPCRLGGTHATPTGAPALQPLLHGAWACTGIAARLQRWLLCGVRLYPRRAKLTALGMLWSIGARGSSPATCCRVLVLSTWRSVRFLHGWFEAAGGGAL